VIAEMSAERGYFWSTVFVGRDALHCHRRRQRDTYLDSDRYQLEVDFRIYSRQLKADSGKRKQASSSG
jgi:hypothetical protein